MSKKTKEKVAETAVHLFYLKGFHGTSVRDIASSANVNVSMISYYFQNKQGLLEFLIVNYFESYLQKLEKIQKSSSTKSPVEQMEELIDAIIHYKQENHQFTSFIQRELSKDNILVRELLVTYLAKEKYLFEDAFYQIVPSTQYSTVEKEILLFQLKGLLQIPFTMPYEWKSMVGVNRSDDVYLTKYVKSIKKWVRTLMASGEEVQ
ncbi:forespore capture DNA-binding protein RefZ [Salinibacillus xinjiangensis]|uniref:Forespore capture DNA-binding protein RefZ n=1 Tax=Salinibacillus xinjiangensis TaxID=1229268 RepID=A0A6G1X9Z1_9BACI|nr:forespore capture DNA-binding protein RefZ [Salinibacillus xinjiangensis]MRG87716.1 forespore capture DNA-binding protein RefZ [Salinibacillus xinjiangensis]